MSRHRNVRAMNIDEEYEGYYDSAYGHSVEEEFCISPRTEAQFLYNRDAQKHSMSAFLGDSSDSQLDEHSGSEESPRMRCDSMSESQSLSNIDKAKLQSCVEAMQNVVGDTIVESILTKAAIDHGFDVEKALDAVLSGSAFETPKPQRTRKQGGIGKEFCIHRKCAAQNYNGWVSKNCLRYNNNVIQRNGCSKFPSIFKPWILESLKDSAFFDFCPFAESLCCEIYVQNGFASPLHTFYSLPVSFDSYSRNSVYKQWEDDCHLTAELKSEFRNQEVVNGEFLLSEESTFVEARHHIKKLLRLLPGLFHQQDGLTAMEPLLYDDKHFSEILQVIKFTPCTVLPPFLCTSSDFLLYCRNCSSFTVPITRVPSDQKCGSYVINVEQSSIKLFLSLYRFLQYEMHPLLNSNHYVLCNAAFSQTDPKQQMMQYITKKGKDKCGPKIKFLERHVWFFCCLLFYLSKFKSIKSVAISALHTAMFELWLHFEKCERDSYCKHEQLSFNVCMKALRKDCPKLVAILDSLKSDFSKFGKEGKLVGCRSPHFNKRNDRRQRQNRKKQRVVSCPLLNVSQELLNGIPKIFFLRSQKCAEDGSSSIGNCEFFEIGNFCGKGSFAINVVSRYDKHAPHDFDTTAVNVSGTGIKNGCSKIVKYKMIHPEFMHTLNLSKINGIFSGINSVKVFLKYNCFYQITREKSLYLFPVPSSLDQRYSLAINILPPTSLPQILIVSRESQAAKHPEFMFSTDIHLKSVCNEFPTTGLTEFHADEPLDVHSLVQPCSNKLNEYCGDTDVYGDLTCSDVSPSLNAPEDLDTRGESECNSDSETCDDLSLDDLFVDLPSSKKPDSAVRNSECYSEIESSDFSITKLLDTYSSDAKEISLNDQQSSFLSPPLTAESIHVGKFENKNSRDLCYHSELSFSSLNLCNAEMSKGSMRCLDHVEKEGQDTGLCNKSKMFSPNDQILLDEKSGIPLSDIHGGQNHSHIHGTSDISALQYKISNCYPSNLDYGNISGLTEHCSENESQDLSLLNILCNEETKMFSTKQNVLLSDRSIGQKFTVPHENASINDFLCDFPCKTISSVGNKSENSESLFVKECHNSFVPQNGDVSSISLADLCPVTPLTDLSTGEEVIPKNSLSGMYKVFDPKEEITVKKTDSDFIEDSSDKENDVLSFSLSDIYFNKTNETTKRSHKTVCNISPLTQCNAKIPNLSVEQSFDVMGGMQGTCLHSKSQSLNHSNGTVYQSEVSNILLSGACSYGNQEDFCGTLDSSTLKNKISKCSAADTSHSNISHPCTDTSENAPILSFSDFLNKESNNEKQAANTCVNDSSYEFSCIAIPSVCSIADENSCFKESCNSFAPLSDLTTVVSTKNSNAIEQDSVSGLSLSDLYSEMQFSHSFPGDKAIPINSLSDCADGFQPKKDIAVGNNFGDAEFQNLSLSDLYHVMKPKAHENCVAYKDTDEFPSTILSNSSLDLELNQEGTFDSTVNHDYSLLDLYISSESDKLGYSEDSNDTRKQTPVGTLDFEFSCMGPMNELKTDFENVRAKNDLGTPEINKISTDCKYDYCDIKGVSNFLSANNCFSSTNAALERDQHVHSEALLESEHLQLTTSASKLHHNLDVEDQTDLPYIDLSVARKLSPEIHTLVSSLSYPALAERDTDHGSKIPTSPKKSEDVSEIKTKNSLFAKVLSCKTKPPKSCIIPKPPQTLSEILEFIHYNKHFDFTTPSPDDEVKMKQIGASSSSGSASTIKAPNLETVEDEKEFVFERELSGRLIISNGEVKTPDEIEKSGIENSTKEKAAVPEDETDHENRASEKQDVSPNEDRKSKNDETSTPQPTEQISKLKNEANVKEVLTAYQKERGGNKPLINLVVIGHVDAGKSTLMGHLLYRLGCVAKKIMHKYEQDSKKLGKSSFMYAWVLDETSEERNRGITMDVAQSRFETPHRSVTLLDAPGHKDFIPNMITGAAQADVAILVLDSTRGEFETGFEAGGQTREHTMLIRSLGVSQLAVAVNKLDNVNWDQERYNEIVSKLSSFLKQAGFKEAEVQFVPCSGLTGENLIKPPETPELKKWYSGPCLVDVIDNFKPPERPVSKPFRFCISDVFKGMGSGFCVSGRIEAGYVQSGDKVLVMPAAEQAAVKGITIDEMSAQHSFAGDHVTLQLSGVDMNNVTTGCVVCEVARPVKVCARFQARLVIFNITVPITKGFPVILHYQSMSEQANVKKLISQLHRSTGQVVKKKPRCLAKNTSAVVEIEVIRPICLEVYKDFKELGRFMLRSGGSTIAAGLVTEIL